MPYYDKTIRFIDTKGHISSSLVTIFDSNKIPQIVQLNEFGKNYIYFGRDPKNDIVLTSHLVSAEHGRFVHNGSSWIIEDKAAYKENGSKNGLIYNNASIISHSINDGDFIRIDDGLETISEGVLLVFSSVDSSNKWHSISLPGKQMLTIGRENSCDIILPHVSVSKVHAKIIRKSSGWYIEDNGSTNGIIVNNKRISGKEKLHEKDVISITNSKLIFTSAIIYYCCYKNGISVDASNIVIRRGRGKKSFIASNHVSLNIKPGELVAIIGGSGDGKSTILNCLCGYLQPTLGEVYINGVNLYQNLTSLKKLIGYVPQTDIVYDNLTLYDMLMYTAKLRLPKDTTRTERESAITKAIEMVELLEVRDRPIKLLSGGQRKRASIAVELLSDPQLLFLDEPTSGLDPGIERNLMQSLRRMADDGKTIILVTHSTLQLKICDKIVFIGKGGNLCFFGSYKEALSFFGVSDIVDVYNMIAKQSRQWSIKFEKARIVPRKVRQSKVAPSKSKKNRIKQLCVLSSRYLKLIINDKRKLLLLLILPPLLPALISIVANGQQFEQYETTKSLLFVLSCAAFWLGMLNSIQEICKERIIMKREYMTGLSLSAYIFSKILVLGFFCLIQSALITSVFGAMVGLPEEGVLIHPYLELLITTFFTAVASTAMGLFISSFFTNADRAMTAVPVPLMLQILFSGLIFDLDGTIEIISWSTVCRWSMEGYGTTANLNNLPLQLQQAGIMVTHKAESYFEFTSSHLLITWWILILYIVIFLVITRLVLSKVGKEKS